MGIASIRWLSRPSGRIETQDASGSTDNPLGLVSLRQAQDKRQAQPKDTSRSCNYPACHCEAALFRRLS